VVLRYSEDLRADDPARVEALVRSTGFFNAEEIAIARELADDRLDKGPGGDYRFVIAHDDTELAGFTSFGPTPGTECSWDLYWIAVAPGRQRAGVGRELLRRSEAAIALAHGRRVYVDTSSRGQYQATRVFYQRNGYVEAAHLPDFYAPGDGKIIYLKVLAGSGGR
jgi:GNAT superfamily N-acetyltransferase